LHGVKASASGDRYEPLPGLLGIPAFLVRKLSPRGRRIAAAAGAVLAAGAVAAMIVAVPAITDTKEERAASEQRTLEEQRAQRAAELEAELRLLHGRGSAARGLEGEAALSARRALVTDLAAAVERDAAARVRSGELDRPILGGECERYPRGARGEDPAANLSRPTGRYSCLAVTAEVERSDYTTGSDIGYPYRALVDFRTGEFTYCKVSGKPGEGSLTREFPVTVPAACGGERR
jgi:hypothetical protein